MNITGAVLKLGWATDNGIRAGKREKYTFSLRELYGAIEWIDGEDMARL